MEMTFAYALLILKKAFDRVNWPKIMKILRYIGVDWRERRMIS